METNVGGTDRTARLVAGALAGLLSLGVLGELVALPEVAAPVLGLFAGILLVTSATRSCLVYSVLGIRTCSTSR